MTRAYFVQFKLREYTCRTCGCPVEGNHPASRKDCNTCIKLPRAERMRRARERAR